MQNASDIIQKISTVDVASGLSYASAAASLINGVLGGIDRMDKKGMMTSDMKQYYVNYSKIISIVQDLLGKILNNPSDNWVKYTQEFNKNIALIPKDDDYLSIYSKWHHAIIDPLDEKKLMYYEASLSKFDEAVNARESANIPNDEISTWLQKQNYFNL